MIIAEWLRLPLVPDTVTEYNPATAPLQESVEVPVVVVPDKASVVGETAQVNPVRGRTLSAMLTVPANPFRPVIVTVEAPVVPAFTLTPAGAVVSVKSWTVTVTVAALVRPLLVPVTVTV